MATTQESIPVVTYEARSKVQIQFKKGDLGAGWLRTVSGLRSIKAATASLVTAHVTHVEVNVRMPMILAQTEPSDKTYIQSLNYCLAAVPAGSTKPEGFASATLLPGAVMGSVSFMEKTSIMVPVPIGPGLSRKVKGAMEDAPGLAICLFVELYGEVKDAKANMDWTIIFKLSSGDKGYDFLTAPEAAETHA